MQQSIDLRHGYTLNRVCIDGADHQPEWETSTDELTICAYCDEQLWMIHSTNSLGLPQHTLVVVRPFIIAEEPW